MGHVQSATSGLLTGAGLSSHSVTLIDDVTAANLLVTACFHRAGQGVTATPSGDDWNVLTPLDGFYGRMTVAWKIADGSEGDVVTWTHSTSSHEFCVMAAEYDGGVYSLDDWQTLDLNPGGTDPEIPVADTTPDDHTLALLFNMQQPSQNGSLSGWTERLATFISNGNRSRYELYEQTVDPAGSSVGGDTLTGISDGSTDFMFGLATFTYGDELPPDPDPPDPTDPPWEPPEPSRAIVEIFVNDPDGAKWGEALWGVDVWPAAGWEPIDYASTRAEVIDGTDDGERGILSTPRASRFNVDTFDPDRDLDPNNDESPFAGQLVPGLPIRLRHRSTVFRTARVRTVEWSFDLEGGRITASDLIADLANTEVPPTTDLGDTLYERATDAIAAAGLDFRVLSPTPSGDPALVPYTPERRTVWDVILEAARSVLWVPYVTRDNELGFRSWADGLERGRAVANDELIDLVSWVTADGLYSAVRVLDEATATVIERAATPTPPWGRRVYTDREDLETLDAEVWAETVLADRRGHRLRFRPGNIRPLDADSVETYGTLEVLEGIDVSHDDTDPEVAFHARILGRRVEAVDDTHDPAEVRTRWRFAFTTSAAPAALLVADQDETLYLMDDETEDDNLTTG